MSKRNYDRLPIETFGKHLLVSGDLDPVYIALSQIDWPDHQIWRWCVAYWCLYHCGAACHLSQFEGNTFWLQLLEAARNEKPAPNGGRWPRGSERRHWRGKQAIASWEHLNHRYEKPEYMVNDLLVPAKKVGQRDLKYIDVAERVKSHRGFGPWIAFKIADMVDRVLGTKVDFDEAAVFMFKDPVEAALMLWREKTGQPEGAKPKDVKTRNQIIHNVVGHLEHEFRGMTAPPTHDRPIELQEVETILCKWKSHMNGHYPLNNDIDEITEGLSGWGTQAEQFARAMPTRLPFEQL